jgi:hypothetical protein
VAEKGPSAIGTGRCRRIVVRRERWWRRLDGMLGRPRGAIEMIVKSEKVRRRFVNKANPVAIRSARFATIMTSTNTHSNSLPRSILVDQQLIRSPRIVLFRRAIRWRRLEDGCRTCYAVDEVWTAQSAGISFAREYYTRDLQIGTPCW